MGNRSGLLPVQSWDEINVTHDRTKSAQKVEMVPSKELKQIAKMMKKNNSKSRKKK